MAVREGKGNWLLELHENQSDGEKPHTKGNARKQPLPKLEWGLSGRANK
jgi:hypothetical protein